MQSQYRTHCHPPSPTHSLSITTVHVVGPCFNCTSCLGMSYEDCHQCNGKVTLEGWRCPTSTTWCGLIEWHPSHRQLSISHLKGSQGIEKSKNKLKFVKLWNRYGMNLDHGCSDICSGDIESRLYFVKDIDLKLRLQLGVRMSVMVLSNTYLRVEKEFLECGITTAEQLPEYVSYNLPTNVQMWQECF